MIGRFLNGLAYLPRDWIATLEGLNLDMTMLYTPSTRMTREALQPASCLRGTPSERFLPGRIEAFLSILGHPWFLFMISGYPEEVV